MITWFDVLQRLLGHMLERCSKVCLPGMMLSLLCVLCVCVFEGVFGDHRTAGRCTIKVCHGIPRFCLHGINGPEICEGSHMYVQTWHVCQTLHLCPLTQSLSLDGNVHAEQQRKVAEQHLSHVKN